MIAEINTIILGLTPIEKWQAAKHYDKGYISEYWFVITCAAVLIVLSVLLYSIIKISRKTKEATRIRPLFSEYAQKKGLSKREYEILLDIVARAKLKEKESIFTMPEAFNMGAATIIQKTLSLHGTGTAKDLNNELSILRQKLGFPKQESNPNGSTEKSKKPTSRQIPPGKKLHMTRRKSDDSANIESTVVDNNDVEMTIKMTVSLESRPGEQWCVRYYFGASVWEFETTVIRCKDNILVINHSDNVRFINRRRFLRVPVKQPTYIAQFPFDKTLEPKKTGDNQNDSASGSDDAWGPPDFVPASVTELAGPGLRIEAPLDVNVGDRVLVIFKLEDENKNASSQKEEKTIRIVEDIGKVRHTKTLDNGFSIAVELTGLSDTNINELVRATNAASLKINGKNQNVEEPITVQGS